MAYIEIPIKKPWRPPPGAGTEPVVKEPWNEDEELKDEDSPPTAPPSRAVRGFLAIATAALLVTGSASRVSNTQHGP
jgi:hypothetical protein